jgi:hypothetical protein
MPSGCTSLTFRCTLRQNPPLRCASHQNPPLRCTLRQNPPKSSKILHFVALCAKILQNPPKTLQKLQKHLLIPYYLFQWDTVTSKTCYNRGKQPTHFAQKLQKVPKVARNLQKLQSRKVHESSPKVAKSSTWRKVQRNVNDEMLRPAICLDRQNLSVLAGIESATEWIWQQNELLVTAQSLGICEGRSPDYRRSHGSNIL